jgi:centrosomin
LQDKDLKIEYLQCEKNSIINELQNKNEELYKLKEIYNQANEKVKDSIDIDNLQKELVEKNLLLEEKNDQVDQLTKELSIKTQNLQKLVNTELWSKNKEIAKLHNNMTFQCQRKICNKSDISEENIKFQLNVLIKELNNIGIHVTSMNDIIQLNYMNSDKSVDFITITNYIHKLIAQKNELEKEVDYLKWLKLVSKSVNKVETRMCDSTSNRYKHSNVLRMHLKEIVEFMNEILKTDQMTDLVNTHQKRIIFNALINSKIFSDDFINALEGTTFNQLGSDVNLDNNEKIVESVRKCKSENFIDCKYQFSTPSDSEAFSEPDRMVSLARMGLSDVKQKSIIKSRSFKYAKKFSDSDDSIDFYPCYETYKSYINDFDTNRQNFEFKEISSFLYSELYALRNEVIRNTFDVRFFIY